MQNHIAYYMKESPHYDIKIETKRDTQQVPSFSVHTHMTKSISGHRQPIMSP